MENELLARIEQLENWKKSLERSATIPLNINQSFKERFGGSKLLFGTATIDFSNIAANASESKSIPVLGASPGDAVIIGFPTTSGIVDGNRVYLAAVLAPDVVTLTLTNKTAGALDLASAVFTAVVVKKT